jgi:tetratricopeptide (TPR) repeat protein
MGLVDSVPAAFELTVVNARERLSFTRPPPMRGHDWGGIVTLELDVPARDDDDGGPRPTVIGHPDTPPSVALFQSRRLRFRTATLATTPEQLQTVLGACPLTEAGFQETRVWMDPAGLHLGGRFTVGNAEAPFTIRVAFNPRPHGSRRLEIDFADVRLFAHLPIPDPSVGVAMARAIAKTKALGMAAMVQVNGSTIDIDPLEVALVFALVSRGWRLPDLGHAWLRTVVQKDAELWLSFDGEEPDTLPTTTDSVTGATAAIYARQPDPELRAEALSTLWEEFARLPPERQHDAYASFGRVAESTGDLEHAEEAYWRATNIAGAPDQRADDLVAHARVLLSRGNGAAAVTELEEAANVSPRHVPARQALARLALERHDLRTAAERLDEVLRLFPPHAIDAALDVRLHLMEVQAGLGDWAAAQGHAEFLLAHDPGRISVLERLADIYQQQGLDAAAADAFDRLARLYPQPRRRAEALLRSGDIFLERLGDETRAFDSYLKSSDLDATFVPTTLRLISAYWSRGRYDDIAGLSEDLRGGGTLPALDTPPRVRLAVAVALAHGDADRGAAVAELASLPWDANSAAEVLAEMAAHSSEQPLRDRELAAALIEIWRATQNA